ncbi:MAG: YcxB family protein [Deltaproteobacteria bacterium]|nr:YcxB family protein [Deltaproteobacteria bacterium]
MEAAIAEPRDAPAPTVTWEHTIADHLAFQDHQITHAPHYRRRIRVTRILYAVISGTLAALGFSFYARNQEQTTWFVLGAFYLALGAYSVVFYPSRLRRSARRLLPAQLRAARAVIFGRTTLTVTARGLESVSPQGESWRPFDAIERVETTPLHHMIYLNPLQAIALPRHRLLAGDADAVAAALHDAVERAHAPPRPDDEDALTPG